MIRIARKVHILWINSWLYSPRNLGSFQLNCHLVSLIFFHDDRKTQPPWLHVSDEFCFDLWFIFLLSESVCLTSTFSSFLQSLRNASNFSAQNWWYWRVWWDFNLLSLFPIFVSWFYQHAKGLSAATDNIRCKRNTHLQNDPLWISL